MSSIFDTAFSKSRITWNSLPLPGSLQSSMVPPMASTIHFVIAIPRPVPSVLSTWAVFSRVNVSKIVFWNSGVMPIPLSRTRKWHLT